MPLFKSLLLAVGLGLLGVAGGITDAHAADPGLEAVEDFRRGGKPRDAIENRFFLKEGRFEIAPMFGYVPNNPFATRILGGLFLGYHFNEDFSVQATIAYSPDLKEDDLKGLTSALVFLANQSPAGANFQQPLDKMSLWAAFGGTWSPFYGKINLIGETVVNFDAYLAAGVGIVSKLHYNAVYDSEPPDYTRLEGGTSDVVFSPNVGFGMNFFLNQFMALKLDARFTFWVDEQPQYCTGGPNCDPVTAQRLYNNFVVSVGLGFFVPNMKPRLYDF